MTAKAAVPTVPVAVIPGPPPELPPDAADRWQVLAPDVLAVAGGAATDWTLLRDLVIAERRLAQVTVVIEREGVTATGSMGQPVVHPLVPVEQSLRQEIARAFDRLGLAPAGRHAFGVGPDGRLRKRGPFGLQP
jgi:P27 family predicted phage terminase small subunit